jgi:PTH1 family peptidyl-tRNA hydrolase
MKSVIAQLGSQLFPRLRVGIGQGPPGRDAARYVLGRFTREEEAMLPEIYDRAADAIDLTLREGLTAAMNRYNAPEAKGS